MPLAVTKSLASKCDFCASYVLAPWPVEFTQGVNAPLLVSKLTVLSCCPSLQAQITMAAQRWMLMSAYSGLPLPVFCCWHHYCQFSLVQSHSCVWLLVTPWTAAYQASLSIINSRSLPKLTSIESVMPSNHLILCRPLLLLPPIPPSIRVFSNESALHIRWPKYWSFSFNISPSNEHPGLISFRMDWLDLLAVQGTLKSLLQHHNSKA